MTGTVGGTGGTVVGIDPGTRHLGWGVVRREGTRLVHLGHGVIHAREDLELGERLVVMEAGLIAVLGAHAITGASVEQLFFAKDATAAAKLGHARGVALLVCARAGLPIAEYAATQVKRTVAGNGHADKRQVAEMMRVILRLPSAPPSDAGDALAIAVTHLQSLPLRAAMPQSAVARPAGARGRGRGTA
jgi:crossover junction endodeoxyribonuclease RuvC